MKLNMEKFTLFNFINKHANWLIRMVRYIRGKKFLNKLISEKKDDESYIILEGSIGDSLYGLSCLEDLHNKYPSKKLVIVGSENIEKLLKSYPYVEKVIFWPYSDKKKHRQLLGFMLSQKLVTKGISKGAFSAYAWAHVYNLKSHSGQNAISLLKKVFDLPSENITYHGIKVSPISSIPNFEMYKDRIVIINPYSKSAPEHTVEIYEDICNELLGNGYLVYTNVVGDQKTVKGSKPLKCSIYELYSIACSIPLIVSTRSGILDLLAPSNINMFVLHKYTSEFMAVYTLSGWQCKGKIEEIFIDKDKPDLASIREKFTAYLEELKKEGRI